MLKLLSGHQVKELDAYYIQREGISSLELMERAALSFVAWWDEQGFSLDLKIAVFCGAGNNGGDGFAIARLLHKKGYVVKVFTCFDTNSQLSSDAKANFDLLPADVSWTSFDSAELPQFDVLVDCFLGVGLKGALRASAKEVVSKINSFSGPIVSVDMPSGLPSDSEGLNDSVCASTTVTFAFPKVSLLFPENASSVGELAVIDIGIDESAYSGFDSHYYFIQEKDIYTFHRKFSRFAHKGDYGKVLLVAGSAGKMGAAILCSKSALKTGSGLVNTSVPWEERIILQTAVPEAMVLDREAHEYSQFDAIGIGPGLGIDQVGLLTKIFNSYSKPMVLDADALTILSQHPELIDLIPKGSILTPHLGEFERLFGKCSSHFQRMTIAREFCIKNQLNLLIKGANSVISLADGIQIFNSSGTKYMATGGSGDVLTGMLTSFLGQDYSPEQALICGVFQHGLAGEIASKTKLRSTIASDILEAIPETFLALGID